MGREAPQRVPYWIEDAYMREPVDDTEEADLWDAADNYRKSVREDQW